MTTQQREILRVWLAQACGVGPDQVTDEHVERWKALNDEIRAYRPTGEQATGVRALARSLGVHPLRRGEEPLSVPGAAILGFFNNVAVDVAALGARWESLIVKAKAAGIGPDALRSAVEEQGIERVEEALRRYSERLDRRASELLRKTSPTPEEISWLIAEGYGLEDMSGGGVRPSPKGARVMREAAGS